MTDFHEQRMCVKFCVKLEITFTETLEILKQASGNESMGRTQTYDWYKGFKDGRISIEDDPRSVRPPTSTGDQHVAQVRSVTVCLHDESRVSVRHFLLNGNGRNGFAFWISVTLILLTQVLCLPPGRCSGGDSSCTSGTGS
jgi:hypothetical protein